MIKNPRYLLCLSLVALLVLPLTRSKAAEKMHSETAAAADAKGDAAWKQLRAAASPASDKSEPNKKGPSSKAEREAKAKALVEVANQARGFYAAFPSHSKASAAKKLEVTSLLDAVDLGAVSEEARATQLGTAYRNDHSHSETDRFHVARQMMELEVEKKKLRAEARMDEIDRQADALLPEFPGNAGVFRLYLEVVENGSEATARQVASKILSSSSAPATVKDQARTVIERYDLVGKSVALDFVSESGTAFKLADKRGKIVIAYVWSGATRASEAAFASITKAIKPEHEVVGINVDKDVAKAKATIAQEKPPGLQYVDERGLGSPVATQLKVVDVPCVYVFKANGELAGFGSTGQLSKLLKSAAMN
ncbi:MAG TPA: hypothetical protein VHO24_06175 [Opitutaceae bacterium]|nr:hypothetical protein [Opitutaceae bacterium]